MSMHTYTISSKNFNGVESFYDELTRVMRLPAYFGRNLDAVYDCLSEMEWPIQIVWQGSDKSRTDFWTDATQPGFFGQIKRTLEEVDGLELVLE
jgi:RNAse (barnase) inhibitor barstar